jgi:hypothetical protein
MSGQRGQGPERAEANRDRLSPQLLELFGSGLHLDQVLLAGQSVAMAD